MRHYRIILGPGMKLTREPGRLPFDKLRMYGGCGGGCGEG